MTALDANPNYSIVEQLWTNEGQPPCKRTSDEKAKELFWTSDCTPNPWQCQQLLWNESRGAYGPWCGNNALTDQDTCRFHTAGYKRRKIGTPAQNAMRRIRWRAELSDVNDEIDAVQSRLTTLREQRRKLWNRLHERRQG